METFEKDIVIYRMPSGLEPFSEWLFFLKDKVARYRIETRIDRVRHGNYGDCKRFKGIIEFRLDFGKGYRVYCGEDGDKLIVLLMGGDKSSQDKDIAKALSYWEDYNETKKIQDI